MKVMFHLHKSRPNIGRLLKTPGCTNANKQVPYYDFNVDGAFSKRNDAVDAFGMFYDLSGNFLNLRDVHVLRPKDIIARCAVHVRAENGKVPVFDTFHQRGLIAT